jgi:predicted HTH transcriptional regulator
MQEIRTPLPRIVDDAVAFVEKHTSRAAVFGAVRRVDRWPIPPEALREIVINSVIHADYSQIGGPLRLALYDDRLEVENPGLPPAGVTIEDMKQGISKPRNRVIARFFQEWNMVEQWGSGVRRMTDACLAAGLPEPEFEEIATHFRVTVRAATRYSQNRAVAARPTDRSQPRRRRRGEPQRPAAPVFSGWRSSLDGLQPVTEGAAGPVHMRKDFSDEVQVPGPH